MITEKLLAIIEYSGLSQTAFAKKVGSTQANLWRQLNGQRVNVATLVAVAQQFPEIDCNCCSVMRAACSRATPRPPRRNASTTSWT